MTVSQTIPLLEYYALALSAHIAIGLLARRRYVPLLTRIDPPHFGTVIVMWPLLVLIDFIVILARPIVLLHSDSTEEENS